MVITAVYTLGFLMTQAMGAGLLLQALSGFNYHVGMVVVLGVATLYTLFGGMRAVIGTDFIQSLLIMVLLAVVAVLAFRQFPMPEVHAALSLEHPDRLDLLLPAGLLMPGTPLSSRWARCSTTTSGGRGCLPLAVRW